MQVWSPVEGKLVRSLEGHGHWVNCLGITSVVVGTMVAICVGMVTDRIKGKMKVTILGLLVLGRKMK